MNNFNQRKSANNLSADRQDLCESKNKPVNKPIDKRKLIAYTNASELQVW